MTRVGLTGGIGSGKSTVCRLLGLLGVPVYDSDSRARKLMNSDAELRAGIAALLGGEAYRDGVLDREYVAGRVFNDRSLLGRLNALVHPAVGRDFVRWAEGYATGRNGEVPPYVVMESAILLESGFGKHVDRIVTVSAPEELRVARTVGRDGVPPEKVRVRIANQMSDAEREAAADHVVVTDDRRSVIAQVLDLHRELSGGDGRNGR